MIPEETIVRAVELIRKGPANAVYFFQKLTAPDWIEPLNQERLFSSPYGAERRGDGWAFPFWTPGEYLARMAQLPEAQAQVVEIFREMGDSDNPRVYEVIADATAVLPADLVTQLVPQLLKGLDLPYQLLLPEKAAETLLRLGDAGLADEAIRVTRAVFAILPVSPQTEEEEEARWAHREARARVDSWQYGQLLERCAGRLAGTIGIRAFDTFSDLLVEAMDASRIGPQEGPEDFSYSWRPMIAHSKGPREDIRDHLVSVVRDIGQQILETSPSTLPEVSGHLRARGSRVFDRLALFLLTRYGADHIGLVEDWVGGPDNWESKRLRPELDELLTEYFERLSPSIRRQYLEWVDGGPDMEAYVAFRRSWAGTEPDNADLEAYREVWTRDRLGPVVDAVPSQQRDRFQVLVEKHGPPPPPSQGITATAVSRGERSPLTEEDTLALDWPAIIAKAREWTPSPEFDGPSQAGLEGSFRDRVTANPQEAVQNLSLVVDLDPGYVAAILQALRGSVKSMRESVVEWPLVLDFLNRHVTESPLEGERSTRWSWARKCAVALVGEGLTSEEGAIPADLRDEVWRVIGRLAEDPDPTPEHEQQYGGTNMDPATLSLNTVRGDAFHQVVRYSLWWRRHLERLGDPEERLSVGFDELPEVRRVLERHLQPEVDPSLAVRAVYGQWFPWLQLLDRDWAAARVDQIFPEEQRLDRFFWAAWSAYVVHTGAYTDVLPLLRRKYRHAILALRETQEAEVALGERPANYLADHLMGYYWRGEVSLEPDDLLVEFFHAAGGEVRNQALTSIGRGLWSSEEAVPSEVRDRLKALWESRAASSDASAKELQAFGWWFASGQLDYGWSVEALEGVLARGVLPEPDHLVVEKLAAMATDHPVAGLRCLERLIELAADGWSIHGWLDHAKILLETGLGAGHAGAHELATRIIHKLGAMQFQAFRDLLKDVERP